jgi:hypothetical protein
MPRLCARLHEEQPFLLCPPLRFFPRDLTVPPMGRALLAQIHLVADEDAREVWVCVLPYIGEPRTCVHEAYDKVSWASWYGKEEDSCALVREVTS